jgi:GT2 family glycosyltransferase
MTPTAALPTVIIPIHNAPEELEACLASLSRTIPAGSGVVLLDDASDDSRIQPMLRRWREQAGPGWRLERQSQNLGFVGTVNRGVAMTSGDVVLLNSDTILTPGWLQGLRRCLAADPAIATATPWTNNGEIASVPAFCQANPVPADIDAVARVIAASGKPAYPEIPTAVGFCMAIARRALEAIGTFDQELFGLGYGEENDFSMRARASGWKNVLCDDVYVAHVGGRSFSPKGLRPGEAAMQNLLSRHPGYLELIREFIANDPLAVRRDELVAALRNAGIELG